MASLNDIYGGIIKPGPQGGIYQPGPDVQFPNSNVSRVTPEGLNVRSVSTYGVDGNGNPIAKPSASQLQALKIVAAALQPPGARGTTSLSKDQTRLTGTPSPMLAFSGDQGTGAMAPGVAAINGAMMPPGPRVDPRGYFLRGDPGQTDWNIANQGGAGLNGPVSAAYAGPANPPPNTVMRAPAQPKPVMVAPPPNVTNNINRFLNAQGVDTSRMTASEQANALNKAMRGSSRGEFGPI